MTMTMSFRFVMIIAHLIILPSLLLSSPTTAEARSFEPWGSVSSNRKSPIPPLERYITKNDSSRHNKKILDEQQHWEKHTTNNNNAVVQDEEDAWYAASALSKIRGGGVVGGILGFMKRHPTWIILMIASTLVNVFAEHIKYPRLCQSIIQGVACVYIFILLASWSSSASAESSDSSD